MFVQCMQNLAGIRCFSLSEKASILPSLTTGTAVTCSAQPVLARSSGSSVNAPVVLFTVMSLWLRQ